MQYRREIDGLRTLAVLPVIFFHAGFRGFGGGFVGVDVFFVISGFLITSILAQDIDAGRFSLLKFYERRARRILPPLFVVVAASAACALLAWHWLLPMDMQLFAQSIVAVSVFASNVLFLRQSTYFDTDAELKPLLHTWSLSVEEQFYVLYPLLLLFLMRRGRRVTVVTLSAVTLASLAMAQWQVTRNQPVAFYLLHTRAWELMIGALVALCMAAIQRRAASPGLREVGGWLGVALIVGSVFAYDRQTPFPSLYALAPTLGAALVLALADGRNSVGRVLGTRPFVAIGLISYGAYLWHQPLFALARHASLDQPPWWVFAALSVLSLLLAALSYRWIERPFRESRRFSRRQVFSYAVAGSLALAAMGLVGQWRKGFPERFDSSVHAMLHMHAQGLEQRDDGGCNRDEDKSDLRGCVWGDRAATPTWALIGDSAATTLMHPLGDALAPMQRAIVQYTKNECPPVRGLQANLPLDCDKFVDAALADMQARHIQTVVMSARWAWYGKGVGFDNGIGGVEDQTPPVFHDDLQPSWPGPAGYEDALIRRYVDDVRAMLARGLTVVLVYPMPESGWHVPDRAVRLRLRGMPLSDSDTNLSTFRARAAKVDAAFDALPASPALVRVKPADILCDTASGKCHTVLPDGSLLYYDDDHLSYRGGQMLVNAVLKALGPR